MTQEYLFQDEKSKKEIEKLSYKNVKKRISNFENQDFWILTFELTGENERTAGTLSKIHDHITENYKPIIIKSGCSSYYNKLLFPYFNEFERKLRKLLYLKSALHPDEKGAKAICDLEKMDLGEIFTLLFTDPDFVSGAKKLITDKTWKFTKIEIIDALQKLTENTTWDRLIGKDSIPSLRSHFLEVKNYRNDVMHAHDMTLSSYRNAISLIKKINEQLDKEIERDFGTTGIKSSYEPDEDFNLTLSTALLNMRMAESLKSIQSYLSFLPTYMDLTSSIIDYTKLYDSMPKYFSSPEFIELQKNAQKIADLHTHVMPIAMGLKNNMPLTSNDSLVLPMVKDSQEKTEKENLEVTLESPSEDLFATSLGTE